MVQISLEQFANDPQGLLARIAAGEPFVVTSGNRPVAEVHPVVDQPPQKRPIGLCEGLFVVPDDFNEPLPAEILRSFEGE
jgi:antitoxin (DNA-binding transcriptional repressor) of toxin-antitoxin stability system